MEAERKPQDRHPREQRRPDGPGGNRGDEGGRDRNRNRRSGGGGRRGVYLFADQMERAICQLVTHEAPQGFPASARAELATAPPVEVARTGSSILFCDKLHDGPHFWPNGDEVP